MDRKDHGKNELKASMWGSDGFETFECYEKANSNTKKDAETCLQEYSPRFNWTKNSRVLDIGCGDGSVTNIISKYIPDDVQLTASDINEKAIKFANHKYGDGRIQFMRFDVIGPLPEDMIGKFDHVFSMYVFHWVKDHDDKMYRAGGRIFQGSVNGRTGRVYAAIENDVMPRLDSHKVAYLIMRNGDAILAQGNRQYSPGLNNRKAFTNIYNILPKNGEFFSIFLGRSDIYSVFQILAKKKKWSPWMKNIDQFISPYHDYEDPDTTVENMLKKVGFQSVNVKCKQRYCIHDIDNFKVLITGINCFDVPKHMWSEFLEDYVETKRTMDLIDTKGSVKTNYNLLVVHCVK